MKKNKQSRDVKTFQNEITEHFVNGTTHKQIINDCEKTINESLSEPFLTAENRVAINRDMKQIGYYYCTIGSLKCFTDSYLGWKYIKRGFLYLFWSYRILKRQWQRFDGKIRRGMTNANQLTNPAALCLPIMTNEGFWFLDLMNQSLQNKYLEWSGEDYYSIFLVRLYRKLIGETDIDPKPPEHWKWEQPYSNFFEAWNDDKKLHEAIHSLCDYHLCWNDCDSAKHRAEFSDYFAILNPVEIHAIEFVRKQLGLSTPIVEHELLQPPFYPIPDFVHNITKEDILREDDLLRTIIESYQGWCDSVPNCDCPDNELNQNDHTEINSETNFMKKDKIIKREIYLKTTQLNEKLKLFAETLLDRDFDEFQKMFFDLKNLSSGDFSQKYADWLKKLFESDANEVNNLEPSQWYFVDYCPETNEKYIVSPEQFLIDFAQQKGRLAWVDWSGEEANGEVADILDRMLKRHWCTDFEWDIDEFESKLNFDTLERGDYILKLFEAIDLKLKAKNFQLIFFQVGDDAYHYSVLPVEFINKLQDISWEGNNKEYYRVCTV